LDTTLWQEVDDWSFDVFALNDVSDGHALRFVGCELLRRYDVINKFKVRYLDIEPIDTVHVHLTSLYSNQDEVTEEIVHQISVNLKFEK